MSAGTAHARPRSGSLAYVGSYAPGDGLDVAKVHNGLSLRSAVAGDANASWLAYSPDGRFLYSTNETDDGSVTALDLADPANPVVLNSQSSGGDVPTHLSVHPSGRFLFVANYGSGSVAVLPIGGDGTLGACTDLVQHQPGSRPPNAHQVVTDPSGNWVISVDLGADSVYVYEFDTSSGKLTEHQHLVLPDGAGPRHLAFHPGGRIAYIVQELRSEVTVAGWDRETGTLTPGQVVATVGADAPAVNYPGEVQVAADGRFVYVSNRGENSIATFAASAGGATLTLLGHTPTGGDWPRHFTLDATERWIYVSNQRSGTVTWLPLDKTTGTVGPPANSLAVPAAAMVLLR
ncbi:lactonase family protein [Labedaea rhizosphaerae]|nr:lactonase family protein [Labedaea rhizosphaerae]